jgi:PKD repeat protein
VYDPRTDYAYYSVMHDYAWVPSHYLNVFAVSYIYPEGMTLPDGAFIGGMSPFPPSNSLSQALTGGDTLIDGVLIRQDCIGSIGTAVDLGGMGINAQNRTLTHELGHYWNLYHPFQVTYGAVLGYTGCGPAWIGCGDEVDDTPAEGSAAQNTSINCYIPGTRNSCTNDSPDEPDMVENYMDYQWGFCSNIFTLGQKARIDATLISDRVALWSKENLMATGVFDSTVSTCAPIADFNPNYKMFCAGTTVNFTDYSYNGTATGWEWTFTGGTPATSTAQNPTVTYNTAGTFPVKLKAINASGSDSLIKQDLIYVSDPAAALAVPYTEGFEGSISQYIINNPDGNGWEVTDSAKYSGTNSFRVSSFSNNATTSIDEMITPGFNLAAISPVPTSLALKFKLAYTGKTSTNALTSVTDTLTETLKVYISTDCGKSWTMRYFKKGTNLFTDTLTTTSYFPKYDSDWREETVNLTAPNIGSSNLRFKFQVTSGSGNNLYIDDINLSLPSGIEENASTSLNLNIVPNPMNQTAEISFNLNKSENVRVEILDIIGQNIVTLANESLGAGNHSYTMSKQQLGASGFYFVKITVNNVSQIKKVIVN